MELGRAERLQGCLIGTAVGDALLLPSEGLSRSRVARYRPLRHRLFFGRSLLSDDTEHAFLTAQSLLAAGDDADRFGRVLAARLRWWFLALPPGVGLATAKSCVRLWLGWSWKKSGIASAGNGTAMRAAIIGARFARDPQRRQRFVDTSSLITHRDERALAAARAVADTAAWIVDGQTIDDPIPIWREAGEHPAWREAIGAVAESLRLTDTKSLSKNTKPPGWRPEAPCVHDYRFLLDPSVISKRFSPVRRGSMRHAGSRQF